MTLINDLSFTQTIFTRYILTILFTVGVIASILNLIIFGQKRLRSNSCSVYFIATSIYNLLAILLVVLPVILMAYFPNAVLFNSSISCKIRAYMSNVFLMMSRSSVAMACVDRFALCSPNTHRLRLNHYRIAILIVIIITLLWLIVPIHIAALIDIQMPGSRCGASGAYLIIYTIYAAIVTSIPLIIMIVFSYLTFRNLRRIQIRLYRNMENISPRIRKRDTQLMIILMSEVAIYFISTVWFPIFSIYTTITLNIEKNAQRTAVEGFIRYLVFSFLIFLNSCSIFYVHLLVSKAFRQDCKEFFLCFFNISRHNQTGQGTFQRSRSRSQQRNNNQMIELRPVSNSMNNNGAL